MLPTLPIKSDRVMGHTKIEQLIGPVHSYRIALGNHQEIPVGEAVPVASCSGVKQMNLIRFGCTAFSGQGKQMCDGLLEVAEPLRMPLLAQSLEAGDASHGCALGTAPFWSESNRQRQRPTRCTWALSSAGI